MTTGVVVPVRGFAGGKARLQVRLDPAARAALLESMATAVVSAAGDRPLLVVTSAPEVREWAARLGLGVLADPGTLDAAAAAGRAWWSVRGARRVAVVHADLPLACTLDAIDPPGVAPTTVVAVASRDGDGTPALSIPVDARGAAFRFAYGPGSFGRHRREALRVGLAFEAVHDARLAFDVDTPADLDDLHTARSTLLA